MELFIKCVHVLLLVRQIGLGFGQLFEGFLDFVEVLSEDGEIFAVSWKIWLRLERSIRPAEHREAC